ncbi:MAG TPA: hypothetical protein PK366_04540 [Fibrobacteraceae bacterium]|nr:hypothetical protein [Fibrobacteraceae bacterium]
MQNFDDREMEIDEQDCCYDLKDHVVPFFKRHIGELYDFMEKRRASSAEPIETIELLKLFIQDRKLPFDMRHYMNAQSDFIRKNIKEGCQNRQEIVSHWIKVYAEKHRNRAILLQCLYLDRVSQEIIPAIEKMLQDFHQQK